MKGHEYARGTIRDVLAASVPAFLAAQLTDLDVTEPDPDDVEFLLVDDLSMVQAFPVVLVRSTDEPRLTSDGGSGFQVRYEIEIVVACDYRVHGDFQGASTARDRLLLAVREAVLSMTGIPDDMTVIIRGLSEQTGAAAESISGVPMAAGAISFSVVVDEHLRVLDPPESVTNVDVSMTAKSARFTIN